MTDLSKVPDLELRQKVKPLNDKWDALEAQLARLRDEHHAKTAPIHEAQSELSDQISDILDGREIVGTCESTGLPVFDDDKGVRRYSLLPVANGASP